MGVGSSFDTPKLISGLVEAERYKINAVETAKENVETKLSSLGTIITSVQGLKTAFQAYENMGPITLTSASNPTGFSVSAKEGAVETNYDIQVNALAKVAKAQSLNIADTTTTPGTGTLDLAIAGQTYSISIAATDNYAAIVNKVNASGAPITASLIQNAGAGANENYITLTTADTGYSTSGTVSDALSITTDSLGIFNTSARANYITQEATNAQITVDGNLTFIRSSNTITDALPGLDLNLLSTTSSAETLNLTVDTSITQTNVQTMIDFINDTITLLSAETDNTPGTDTQKTFAADSTLRRLQRDLANIVSKQVNPSASIRGLMDMGISSDSTTGLITIDSTKFAAALNSNSRELNEVFTTATNGIIDHMISFESTMNHSLDGILTNKKGGLEDKVKKYEDKILDLTDYIENYEARLLRQFTAMEEKVSAQNAMKSYIEMQMDLLKKDD
tara:strand:+ start:1810 stop:3162 length:1353 start_codon:yes stop_codon:yes gene_type:complete